jgi:hypothetical protein
VKKWLLILLLASSAQAATGIVDTAADFNRIVRQWAGIESTALLPDSTLLDFAGLSILQTSVEAGGVEGQIRVLTVADQKMYELPDSVVAVVATNIITTDGSSRPIKAGYPQYWGDNEGEMATMGTADESLEADDESVPSQYHYWADTLQLLPAPIRDDDTIIVKALVEHEAVTAVGDTLRFTHPNFTTAALYLATSYALFSVGEDERAAMFLGLYDQKKAELIQRYQRRMDVQPQVKE